MILRTIRCLDGIALFTAIGAACLFLPGVSQDALGRLTPFAALPIIAVAICAWRLPAAADASARGHLVRQHMRLSALAMAGLCPFVSWWEHAQNSLYLMLCAIMALQAALLFLYHLCLLLRGTAREHGMRSLAAACHVMQYLLLFPVFCLFSAFALVVPGQAILAGGLPLETIQNLLHSPAVRVLVLLWISACLVAGVVLPWIATRGLQRKLEPSPEDHSCKA